MAAFDRLVRFEAQDGKTYFGDLGKEEVPTREIEGKKVAVVEGSVEGGFKKTGGEATVSKVCLCSWTSHLRISGSIWRVGLS